MNFFQSLYFYFVTQPQLNLLQFYYNLTNDIGWAIILIAITVNLTLWPLFASSYFNLQKTKLFQPKLKEIREKYKQDPKELLAKTGEFNKKHGISNATTFYILFIQLFFVSGIFFLIRDISSGKSISGLYELLYNQTTANFNPLAFGFISVDAPAQNYVWLVVLISVFSYFYGYYTLKLAPKISLFANETSEQKTARLAKLSKEEKEKQEKDAIQEKAMQGSAEFMTLYFSPGLFFFIGLSSPTGVNFYILTTTILSVTRQILISQYYKKHTKALIDQVLASDPVLKNHPEKPLLGELADDPNPTKVVEQSQIMQTEDMFETAIKIANQNTEKPSKPAQNLSQGPIQTQSKKGKNLTTKQKSILKKKKK
jgi:YidC/Oxa1 family membrane protein insertase